MLSISNKLTVILTVLFLMLGLAGCASGSSSSRSASKSSSSANDVGNTKNSSKYNAYVSAHKPGNSNTINQDKKVANNQPRQDPPPAQTSQSTDADAKAKNINKSPQYKKKRSAEKPVNKYISNKSKSAINKSKSIKKNKKIRSKKSLRLGKNIISRLRKPKRRKNKLPDIFYRKDLSMNIESIRDYILSPEFSIGGSFANKNSFNMGGINMSGGYGFIDDNSYYLFAGIDYSVNNENNLFVNMIIPQETFIRSTNSTENHSVFEIGLKTNISKNISLRLSNLFIHSVNYFRYDNHRYQIDKYNSNSLKGYLTIDSGNFGISVGLIKKTNHLSTNLEILLENRKKNFSIFAWIDNDFYNKEIMFLSGFRRYIH